jgi:hypothetical protein
MARPTPKDTVTVAHLRRELLLPLAMLLAMPLLAVLVSLATQGPTPRNLWSSLMALALLLLFLPILSRNVSVGPRGISTGNIYRTLTIPWDQVRAVHGFVIRGRAAVVLTGGKGRLVVTDHFDNFRHLVGFIIEHASQAAIQEGVAPLVLANRTSRADTLILWGGVALMLALVALKYLG